MGRLTILTGSAHTGKSTALYERIAVHMQRGEHAILLVPEQATFAAEQRLCEKLGGLIGVEVYSFERLCERLLSQYGQSLPFLSEQGRCMVLRRAALKKQKELIVFGRVSQMHGFAESMDGWIGRFKQSCITPDALQKTQQTLPKDSLLSRKLHDFAVLYGESESFLSSRYLTAQDLEDRVTPLLADSWLSACHVFVDDLDRPREQVLRLLEQLLLAAASVTMTLRCNFDDAKNDALFAPDRALYARLHAFANDHGLPFLHEKKTIQSAPFDLALRHLETQLFADPFDAYPCETDAVTVLAVRDRVLEVEACADRILELVRQGTLRYRDIAVVVSDMDAYAPLVERAFALRNIPVFCDATRPILGHAAIDFVLSAVRFADGLSVSDALRVVKSGYAGVSLDDAEQFENYLLRYGLYGSEMKEPFHVGEIPEAAERVRAAMTPALLRLRDGLGAKTAAEKVRAVYAYLVEMQFQQQLEAEANALQAEGLSDEAQLYLQMWKTVSELLSQMYGILGSVATGRKEFAALLEEGLGGYTVGVLPGAQDRVVFGDMVRTRIKRLDTLFLLGCNEGLFPPTHSDDALINNGELDAMKQAGLSVWGGTHEQTAADRLSLYALLTKAQRRVCFSYAFSAGGSDLSPSPMLATISALFPKNKPLTLLSDYDPIPPNEAVGFLRLVRTYGAYRRTDAVARMLPPLLGYYAASPAYGQRTKAMQNGADSNVTTLRFGKSLAHAMYGDAPRMSASRLEQFSRCPFAHYLRYGLLALERKEATEKASDAGTFYHDVLDAFVKAVEAKGCDWRTLTEAEAQDVLDAILPPIIASHNDGIFLRNPRLKESLFLRLRTIHWCVGSLLHQLQDGTFTVAASEMQFGSDDRFPPVTLTLSDGTKIVLYGKIDRVDRSRAGDLLRVVDYKTGKDHTFDPTKLLSGESLQLPIYLLAAKGLGGAPSGMFYMPLTLDPPKEGQTPMHRLSGVIANDEETCAATERDMGTSSQIVAGLKRKKDGTLSGMTCSREQLERIVDTAKAIATASATRIMDGEADVFPTESACTYCPYGAVCRFEKQGGRTRTCRKVKFEELLDKGDEQDGMD